MLIEFIPVALSIIIGWLRKGSLRQIARMQFKTPWLAIVALGVQAVIINLLDARSAAFPVLYIISFLILGAFFVLNRRVPFFGVMAAGIFLNFLVIAANGGHMPADARAFGPAAMASDISAEDFATGHVVPVTNETRFGFLGDVIPFAESVPALRAFMSIGDIVLSAGAFLFIQGAMVTRARKNRHYEDKYEKTAEHAASPAEDA